MTTAFPQRPISRQSRQKKAPGETELIALFQLISQPALLVDSFQEQVIQVNSPLLQLTAFSSTEIVGCSLRDILQGLPEHPLSMDDHSGILLARRNRTLLPVNVHVHILDTSGQWMVIFLEPQDESRGNLLNRIEQVIQTLTDMNCCAEEAPLDKVLERTVGLIQALLEVDVVAIYRVDSGTGGIWKAVEVGDTGWLPATISPNELIRLSTSTLWRPGKRMQTELHRSGRIENLTFLASAPIEQSGLLVIADHCQEPPENLEMVLEALARQAGAVLMHQLQLAEMRRLALENHRDLNIWHSVAENAQEGILLLSPDLTVNEMNPAAEWMLGYTDWEVKGELVENILIGPERLSPALEMACQGIPTHNMGNISLHRRNGQSFPAHMEIIPAQRESETLAILIFFSDVSEHLEIRNRTQQLEQRAVLGEVTAVFAHEVRNPINNISTGLQLLSVKLPENDPSQENINRLLVDCQRLNHLMESVLGFRVSLSISSKPSTWTSFSTACWTVGGRAWLR
jgi:PAS domain S-box-containing protein